MTRFTTPTAPDQRRVKRDKCFLVEMTECLYPTLKEAIGYAGKRAVWRVWLHAGRMYRYKVYDQHVQFCSIAHADACIAQMTEGKDPSTL